MEAIIIDGLDENDFRRSIEAMLRHGDADEAAHKLRALLRPYAGEGKLLPARFLSISSSEVAVAGWDALERRIAEYDRPDHRISAFSVAVTEPETAGTEPDAADRLAPCVETIYFSDDAYPFSEAGRSDLLDGYSIYGCEWQGNFEQIDATLSIEGIDDLYGAIARLEARLLASDAPSQDEIRAGSLGACYLAVLIHQAVRDSVVRHGLPRALCVMAGSNGVYPFFDAPVISSEEYLGDNGIEQAAETPPPVALAGEEAEASEITHDHSGYESLLSITVRKDRKKPVLTLDPEEAESAVRLGELAAVQQLAEAGPRSGVVVSLHASDAAAQAPSFADHLESDSFENAASFPEPDGPAAEELGGEPPHPAMHPLDDEPIRIAHENDWDDLAATASEAEFTPATIFQETDGAEPREVDAQPVGSMQDDDWDDSAALVSEDEFAPATISEKADDAEPREADNELQGNDWEDLAAVAGDAEFAPSGVGNSDLQEAYDEPADMDLIDNAAGDLTDPDDIEMPAAMEETAIPDESYAVENPAQPGEFAAPAHPAPSPEPAFNTHHRLRAQLIGAPESSVTLADRIVALLQWLHAWLKRKGL